MSEESKGLIYVLIAALLWGASGVFAQYLFHEKAFNPEWLVSYRLIIPGLILLTVAYRKKGKAILDIWKHDFKRIFIYSIFGIMSVQLTYFITVQHSNAATATVIQYLNPVMVAVTIAFMTKKMPSGITTVAIALALAGTFFITTHGSFTSLSISAKALVWGIMSALAAAFYVMYSVDLIRMWSGLMVVGWGMLAGGLLLSLYSHPWVISGIWDVYTAVSVFYVIIPGSLVTFYLFLIGVQKIGSQKATILSSAEPLSAALLSIAFLGVSFTAMDWLGTACILVTVIILAKDRNQ